MLAVSEQGGSMVRRYWWVNQNQTGKAEIDGGYLWAPTTRRDGSRSRFYENMKEVSPGDLVFSYMGGLLAAVGVARSGAVESPRPDEFGKTGEQWDVSGWRVQVGFRKLTVSLNPREGALWRSIRPLLPTKYAPLRDDDDSGSKGAGLQSVYLAELGSQLGTLLEQHVLAVHPDATSHFAIDESDGLVAEIEERAAEVIQASLQLPPTEKMALLRARRGQGRFRDDVLKLEKRCRLTGVEDPSFLVASHIKPWRLSTNAERLDGNNGLLLTPNADRLFDRGYISFSTDGRMLVAPVVPDGLLGALGLEDGISVGEFRPTQAAYLEHHRLNTFKKVGGV